MGWGYGFEPYVTVGEKKAKAQKALEKLRKKNPDVCPVIIEGRKIAKTWWGIAWNENLENYADYSNRIGRGSAYVKNGFVIDLQIAKGEIAAIVCGSGGSPYEVKITIKPLSKTKWKKISEVCRHKIGSVAELAEGKFPQDLAELFMKQGDGLFPTPREIKLDCSCPDWADMCKHVAAVLYGVGARLDDDPLLFFTLRDIDFGVLLKKSVEDKIADMLDNSGKKSRRIIENADLSGLFGINSDVLGTSPVTQKKKLGRAKKS